MSAMLKTAVSNSMKKAGPKRCLFGVPDRVALKSALDEQMAVLDKDNMNTWNFDFVNNKPLSGAYQWTSITTPAPRRRFVRKPTDITKQMVSLRNIEEPTTPTKSSSVQTCESAAAVSATKCALSEAFTNFAKSSRLGVGLKRKRSCNDITGKFTVNC